MTLEIAKAHGKKFSWTLNMASDVPKARTQIEYSNKVDTNVTTENWTFIEISKMLGGWVGGGETNYLPLYKKSPINLFFLISNPVL